jgi:hypothetical protein
MNYLEQVPFFSPILLSPVGEDPPSVSLIEGFLISKTPKQRGRY